MGVNQFVHDIYAMLQPLNLSWLFSPDKFRANPYSFPHASRAEISDTKSAEIQQIIGRRARIILPSFLWLWKNWKVLSPVTRPWSSNTGAAIRTDSSYSESVLEENFHSWNERLVMLHLTKPRLKTSGGWHRNCWRCFAQPMCVNRHSASWTSTEPVTDPR